MSAQLARRKGLCKTGKVHSEERFLSPIAHAVCYPCCVFLSCSAFSFQKQGQTCFSCNLDKGIESSIVGELTELSQGMTLVEGGKEKRLEHPVVDPFWKAFYSTLEKYSSKG